MDWKAIGTRIRKQREYLGYTREQLAEVIEITPKFCSDIELGVKGMSIPTLCRFSETLMLSVDYILFGETEKADARPLEEMLRSCSTEEYEHAEKLLRVFLCAMRSK